MADDNQGVQDQPKAESKSDQPAEDASREEPRGSQEDLIQVGNRQMTQENLVKSYLEVEKSYQEVKQTRAAEERQIARKPEEDKDGAVTWKDLEARDKAKADRAKLDEIISANPDLEVHRSAIEKIGQVDSKAWEDIINDYNFKSGDSLTKAKSRGIMGEPIPKAPVATKKISDMSSEEYKAWKTQNVTGGPVLEKSKRI